MPDPHGRRDENPCRKIAAHRLGKHAVLDACTRGARICASGGEPHPLQTRHLQAIQARQASLSDAAARVTKHACGQTETEESDWRRGLESLAVLSVLCVSAVNPSGFSAPRRSVHRGDAESAEKTAETTSHKLPITSHALPTTALTLPRPNSKHPAQPLQSACGAQGKQSSACRWGRCAAWR